jgi:SAM-dependent methyltransferase
MTYAIYSLKQPALAADSLGQGWRGESIQDSIDLCRYQTIEPFFMKYLSPTGRTLEAGCGLGRWVFYLNRKGYDVVGVEVSPTAIEAIRQAVPAAPIRQGDILHMDFADSTFDAVISLGVVEHFAEGPQSALAEMRRVLSPGGLLFVSIPAVNVLRALVAHPLISLRRTLSARLKGREYVFAEYRYRQSEFESLLKQAGFAMIRRVCDDFVPPLSIGLYVDFPRLQHRSEKWRLNLAGRATDRILRLFPLGLHCGGIMWVCRKCA